MKKSSVTEVLRTFSPRELDSFNDFITSPYFNRIKNVVKLFSEIRKYSPGFDNDNLEKEKIWKKIFPGKGYNYGIMKNLIHELDKSVNSFLSEVNYRNDHDILMHNIQELIIRKKYDLANKKIKILDNNLEKMKSRDEIYYYYKSKVFEFKSNISVDKSLIEKFREDGMRSLINFFLSGYLIQILHLKIEEQRANVRHDFKFSDHLVEYFRNNPDKLKDEPILNIILNVILSLKGPGSISYYYKAKQIFRDNIDSFDYIDKKNIYNSFLTFCIIKKNLQGFYHLKELLIIFKEILDDQSLLEGDKNWVNLMNYRNIINTAVILKDYDFAKKFIKNYSTTILSENPEGVKTYSDAILYFINEDYQKCLELCLKLNFGDLFRSGNDNHFYKVDIKVVILKCYYELNLTENLLSAADAFKHYVSKSKLTSESMERNYLNFVNTLIEINSVRNKHSKGIEPGFILNKIKLENEIYEKTYLIEKLNNI